MTIPLLEDGRQQFCHSFSTRENIKYGNKPHLFSRRDATTEIVQTILFEIIFFLDSYSRKSLDFFGWYGLSDTFTKTLSGGLSCVFVVSSLSAIVVDGSESFLFPGRFLIRIVSSTALCH